MTSDTQPGRWARTLLGIIAAVTVLSGCASTGGTSEGMRARDAMTPAGTADTSTAGALTANPTVTDPDKYQAVMENEHVRVLRYHDQPGAKTKMHHHPNSVLYALSSFRRRLIFSGGAVKEREFKPGDVMWIPAQSHIGENIGTTDTEVLLVEVLSPPPEDGSNQRRRSKGANE